MLWVLSPLYCIRNNLIRDNLSMCLQIIIYLPLITVARFHLSPLLFILHKNYNQNLPQVA